MRDLCEEGWKWQTETGGRKEGRDRHRKKDVCGDARLCSSRLHPNKMNGIEKTNKQVKQAHKHLYTHSKPRQSGLTHFNAFTGSAFFLFGPTPKGYYHLWPPEASQTLDVARLAHFEVLSTSAGGVQVETPDALVTAKGFR